MPNRSIRNGKQGVDANGNQVGPDRNTVSPPTQSAFGPASASDPAPKSPITPTTRTDTSGTVSNSDNPTADLSIAGAVDRIKNRGAQIDKAVDDAS